MYITEKKEVDTFSQLDSDDSAFRTQSNPIKARLSQSNGNMTISQIVTLVVIFIHARGSLADNHMLRTSFSCWSILLQEKNRFDSLFETLTVFNQFRIHDPNRIALNPSKSQILTS